MAVTSLKNKLKSGSLLVGNAFFEPTKFDSIATVTVGAGGSSSVTFSSIAGTYKHLQLRMLVQTNRATYGFDFPKLQFNTDTGGSNTQYAYHSLYGDGSNASAGNDINVNAIYNGYTGTSTAGYFGAIICDILDYADTNKFKTIRTLGGVDVNGTVGGFGGQVALSSGLWRRTNALDTITLTPFNGTSFSQYSHFALYGVN